MLKFAIDKGVVLMTDKELQKLKRPELLEILLSLKSESDNLKKENEELRIAIDEKNIDLQKSGNIAEAALQLSGIFEAAQRAADTYLSNIYKLNNQKNQEYNQVLSKAKSEAEKIISMANAYAVEIRKKAEDECKKLLDDAKKQI